MKQIILLFFLLTSGAMTICACSVRPEIRGFDWHLSDFKEAKAVFVGRVIEVSIDSRQVTSPRRADVLYKVKFRTERNWKGRDSEITVISDNGESDCGSFNFEVNKKYLVYAKAFQDRLAVWAVIGSPSRPLNLEDFRVRRQLKELNSFSFKRKAKRLHS